MNNLEMEAGEKEMRKAFEEVTTRNVTAAIEFSNETRKMVQGLTKKVAHLEQAVIDKDKVINVLREQVVHLQQKMYLGGS